VKFALDKFQAEGKIADAERLVSYALSEFPFARCEFTTNLAVIYFSTERKDEALQALESIAPLVNENSKPDCMRSLFLTGSLYQELGRNGEAATAYLQFLSVSRNTKDPELLAWRKQLAVQ
jgi:tetratricopeptide (TPR) repeat protein